MSAELNQNDNGSNESVSVNSCSTIKKEPATTEKNVKYGRPVVSKEQAIMIAEERFGLIVDKMIVPKEMHGYDCKNFCMKGNYYTNISFLLFL